VRGWCVSSCGQNVDRDYFSVRISPGTGNWRRPCPRVSHYMGCKKLKSYPKDRKLFVKKEEQLAAEFLRKRFGDDPLYEPLGNGTPPDFSIDGTACEVRRLNQRYIDEGGANEGLEQIDIPLNLALQRKLSEIPFSAKGGSMFWGSKFKRPLEGRMGRIVAQLAQAAREHYEEGSRKSKEISVGGVTLDLIAYSTSAGKAFIMGYTVDDDSGGMLGDIYPTSIRLALEEKIAKTKSVADKFDRWILILVDNVLPGMMEPNDIGPLDLNLHHFNCVAILNPDSSLALEYPAGSLKLHCRIRQRAYQLYEERDRHEGHELEDWLKAEGEVSS
jgi:hypothetical protein